MESFIVEPTNAYIALLKTTNKGLLLQLMFEVLGTCKCEAVKPTIVCLRITTRTSIVCKIFHHHSAIFRTIINGTPRIVFNLFIDDSLSLFQTLYISLAENIRLFQNSFLHITLI